MPRGANQTADETTSLLINQRITTHGAVSSIASETDASEGTEENGDLERMVSNNAEENGALIGEPITKSQNKDDRAKQYEGIPEVRRRMKYIFPALGIGVMLAAMDQTIIVTSAPRIGSDLDALNKTSWIATA